MGKRLEYDEGQAAGRLRVGRPAFRWAVHTGVVPAPDAGPGVWSRAAVESMDVDAIRAGLPGYPLSGRGAADVLARALGTPNPVEGGAGPVVVSVFAVRAMVTAGYLTDLSGDPEQPALHPDQVAALATHPNLAHLLAQATPLGPDQAAARLGVRRADFDHLVRLGWVRSTEETRIRFGAARGGTVWVPLYRAEHVDRVPLVHPEVDWPALRALGKGRRSPLARIGAGGVR
ncbi:hypothetical protein [Streptomyces sp. H27-H5]|uniref:hypothetical protein n=1 Tax=Streptomyces sp. H27-H5 TaxID=2996460 RepID=UPI00226E2D88|nr:hypothetical protein [Streptomyces sp. H27-H5]MCY0963444.1 hypothetical protein [Streptomyces sp. H27-H5]